MNLLLTGGTGYIGSHAAVARAQAGHEVVLYDNRCSRRSHTVQRSAQIMGCPLPRSEGDVHDTALLTQTLQDMGASTWHWYQQSEKRTI